MLTRNQGDLQFGDQRFTVTSERTARGEHIRVLGEMDMSVTHLLDREIQKAEAGDASRIVLDLDQLEFLDAAGVRLLLDLKARSDGSSGRLRMTRASSPHVCRMLEVTGASELLPFVD